MTEAVTVKPVSALPHQHIELPMTLANEASKLPTRAYPDDAGLDLYTSERIVIPSGQFRDVPTGVSVQLPDWAWAEVRGRSSTMRKRNLLVYPGVIDAGWRGELFAGVWNLGPESVVVDVGERLAQLILYMNSTLHFRPVQVGALTPHARGINGFGSSGR